ncbi:MAG: hypothetical protein H0V62_13620 [Gammaproteobacteria bacterium]|nr:hypothetical protein [Gammaproteobacteria bacterium]
MSDQSKQHAQLPRLCADCEAVAHQRAATAMDNWVMTWCQHRRCLAVAFRRGGKISSWSLQGPLSDAEAQEHAKKIIHVTKPAHPAAQRRPGRRDWAN